MADSKKQTTDAAGVKSLIAGVTACDAYRLAVQGDTTCSDGCCGPKLTFSRVWLRPEPTVTTASAASANDALTKALAADPQAVAAVVLTAADDSASLTKAFADARRKGLVLPAPSAKAFDLAAQVNEPAIVTISAEAIQLADAHTQISVVLTGVESNESLVPTLRDTWNTLVDISFVTDPLLIVSLLQAVGPWRLIWGSAGGSASLSALAKAAQVFGLNDDDRRNILGLNAMRLLGLADEPTDRTQSLYRHARTLIPGGTQLLSKRPELAAPDQWPAYFNRAKGCEIWDLDGKHYYDFSYSGIGATVLGFNHPAVSEAVRRRVSLGSWCTLNPPEEIELAEELMDIHPWAKKVRFTRTGGETAMVAVRIARATTGRSKIAICGYHGWHDWYLAANLGENDSLNGHLLPGLDPCGVPRELRGTTMVFRANNRQELQSVLDAHGNDLAAIVMEPCRYHAPEPGFLEFARDAVHAAGGVVIYDEITIGWKLCLGGAHLKFGVHPDIAVFGKTLANGHPMGAVLGTTEAMEGAHKSFISSSFWTESVGPAAALATLKVMRSNDIPAHVDRIGRRLVDAWLTSAKRHGLPITNDGGYPCLAHFTIQHDLANELRTLYTQLMLKRGFLATVSTHVMFGHDDKATDRFVAAVDEVFGEMADILRKDRVRESLTGPVAHSGFKRLTN